MKKIKSITTYTSFHPQSDHQPSNWFRKTFVQYDSNGNIISEESFSPEGALERKVIFRYDAEGYLTSEILYTNEATLTEILSYKHDSNGNLQEIQHQFEDGSLTKEQFSQSENEEWILRTNEFDAVEGSIHKKYNADQLLIEEIHYNQTDQIQSKYEYIYGTHDLLQEHREYGENGKLNLIFKYHYNKDHRLEKQITYTPEGKIVERFYNYYDQKGRIVKTSLNNAVTLFYYDDKDRCIKEEVLSENGKPEATSFYSYNDEDLISQIISYQIGDPYDIEPQVVGRSPSKYEASRLKYQYYEE